MILKGNERGGGRQLAVHLMNVEHNEHVHVHEVRGFLADDLHGALHEAYAVSKGTKAKNFLFSLSLNPPPEAKVSTADFEKAIDAVERKLGLDDQPRAIVFHEKEGRRHAHAVWSRIDASRMKAVNLPHYKTKLCDVSRSLYIEHGWRMPRGLVNSKERDPANYTLEEWQQAKRGGHDPKALKTMFQECWAASDSGPAFAHALKDRGYTLAQGDRGHVAVDYRGEVYAVSRYTGQRAKEVRAKLGDPAKLPKVEQVQRDTAERMTAMLKRHIEDVETKHKAQEAAAAFRRADIVQRQRQERMALEKAQIARRAQEARDRAQRYRKGLRGLWDRVTGKHGKLKQQNALEAVHASQRDQAEKDKLIFRQLDERRNLHLHRKQAKQIKAEQVAELHRDIAQYDATKSVIAPAQPAKDQTRERLNVRPPRGSQRGKDFDRER